MSQDLHVYRVDVPEDSASQFHFNGIQVLELGNIAALVKAQVVRHLTRFGQQSAGSVDLTDRLATEVPTDSQRDRPL